MPALPEKFEKIKFKIVILLTILPPFKENQSLYTPGDKVLNEGIIELIR